MLSTIGSGLADAFLMAWEVWWALILGFAISAIVQAWVPRERIQGALGSGGVRSVTLATALGAASSSCSYAAIAIAKSLFARGASAAAALGFQFASTNLVFELGAVIWVLIGWQFTIAEFAGGLVMVLGMSLLLRLFVSRGVEQEARAHAAAAETGHQHEMAATELPLRRRLVSAQAWSDVAHNFRNDLAMLWKEIAVGFLLAGFIGQLHNGFFESLFIRHAPGLPRTLENVVVGPLVAIMSFVCSVGNIPLAAVLWSGGISFAGVLAFVFADLLVLPILAIYRKYYGTAFTVRIAALMLVTIVIAALIVSSAASLLGLIPAARPSRNAIFPAVTVDYRLVLNLLALAAFATLLGLTIRRGATCPECGMRVDRRGAVRADVSGRTGFFCSGHCLAKWEVSSALPAARAAAETSDLAVTEGCS